MTPDLLRLLNAGPLTTPEIAQALGITHAEALRLVEDLVADGRVRWTARGWAA